MLKNKKNIILIASLAVIGIILITVSSIFEKSSANDDKGADYEKYIATLEKKIEDFLLNIDGISKADVIITLDTNKINESALDFSSDNDSDLTSYPSVKGIAIACTNGDSDIVKMNVTRLISAYLGLPSSRIEIIGIK